MADIVWVVPGLIKGSGGHRTILRHAHALENSGHRCWIYIEGSGSPKRARSEVEHLFGYRFERVFYGWNDIAKCDIAIATVWYSSVVVRDLNPSCIKVYFVQDFEAYFHSMGDGYLMAENSYTYGLIPVTIGRWLKHKLNTQYGLPAYNTDFCADESVYRPIHDAGRENAVCFVYQPEKPRRCARLGLEALGIVKHRMPETEIYLYGSPESEAGKIWFEHKHMGLLTTNACNILYNRCSVGLCLSSSNPSRIPFEMMAAGLPVVDLKRENNVFDLPSGAVLLGNQTQAALAECIVRILKAPELRESMSRSAIDYMESRKMSSEIGMFVEYMEKLMRGERPIIEEVMPVYEDNGEPDNDGLVGLHANDIHHYSPKNRKYARIRKLLGSVVRKTRRYWE